MKKLLTAICLLCALADIAGAQSFAGQRFAIARGGTVSLDGGNLVLGSATLFTGNALPGTLAPYCSTLIQGSAYSIGPMATAGPLTVQIKYDPANLPSGVDASTLHLFQVANHRWTLVAGSSVNVTTHIVSGTVSSTGTIGNLTQQQDALNFLTTNVYATNSNRVAASVDAMNYRTTFQTDLAGQTTGRQNAQGNWITFGFDSAGRQNVIQNELGFAFSTAYDAAGRAVSTTDGTGRVRSLTYDALGRTTGILYTDGSLLTMQFDALGHLTTMVDSGGTTTYAYSRRSELVGKTDPDL